MTDPGGSVAELEAEVWRLAALNAERRYAILDMQYLIRDLWTLVQDERATNNRSLTEAAAAATSGERIR